MSLCNAYIFLLPKLTNLPPLLNKNCPICPLLTSFSLSLSLLSLKMPFRSSVSFRKKKKKKSSLLTKNFLRLISIPFTPIVVWSSLSFSPIKELKFTSTKVGSHHLLSSKSYLNLFFWKILPFFYVREKGSNFILLRELGFWLSLLSINFTFWVSLIEVDFVFWS